MAQEKPWRPADYWQESVYAPLPSTTNWAFEASKGHDGAERPRAQLGSQRRYRRAHLRTAWSSWSFSAAVFMGGLAAGSAATAVAVVVLHLA
jgi:hypothetical protein